jgi:hypothetical protein
VTPAGDVSITDDDGAFLDIDTPETYERVVRGRSVGNPE